MNWALLIRDMEQGSPVWVIAWMVGLVAIGIASGTGCLLVRLLTEAIDEVGLTELQACQEMEIDQAQWHRQKVAALGAGLHASLQRADRLPADVLARWGEKLALQYGDAAEYERRAHLYMALRLRSARMAKARIAPATAMKAVS
jgi:hypothetical protein